LLQTKIIVNNILINLLVSGSFGALIGLERQWERQTGHPDQQIPAGVRTFTILAILGATCSELSKLGHTNLYVAGLLAIAAWFGIFLYFHHQNAKGGAGLTTAATGMLTYLLGGLVVAGESTTALVLTVGTILLLACKPSLHSLSKNFTPEDARMALQFLAVTGAILPLVPNTNFGPYNALNLHSIWLMVVIVSGLGFVGYIAARKFGTTKGLALTGLAGGLASSTATTLGMSKMSRSRPELSTDCAGAIIIACTIMIWRVAALIAAISYPLAIALLPNFLLLSIPGILFVGFHVAKKRQPNPNPTTYQNPLSLKIAIQFGLLYAAVVLVVKFATTGFGDAGLLAASFISGLTDLDAISLSISNLTKNSQLDITIASKGIIIALIANTLLKAGFTAVFGSQKLKIHTIAVLGCTVLIGAGILLYNWS